MFCDPRCCYRFSSNFLNRSMVPKMILLLGFVDLVDHIAPPECNHLSCGVCETAAKSCPETCPRDQPHLEPLGAFQRSCLFSSWQTVVAAPVVFRSQQPSLPTVFQARRTSANGPAPCTLAKPTPWPHTWLHWDTFGLASHDDACRVSKAGQCGVLLAMDRPS